MKLLKKHQKKLHVQLVLLTKLLKLLLKLATLKLHVQLAKLNVQHNVPLLKLHVLLKLLLSKPNSFT